MVVLDFDLARMYAGHRDTRVIGKNSAILTICHESSMPPPLPFSDATVWKDAELE